MHTDTFNFFITETSESSVVQNTHSDTGIENTDSESAGSSESLRQQPINGSATCMSVLNNDISMYLSNSEMSKQCRLCGITPENLAAHYVHKHPLDENRVARLSPDMAEKALKNKQSAKNMGENLYLAICLFCELPKKFRRHQWLSHFSTHTGELAYKCTSCHYKDMDRRTRCCDKSNCIAVNSVRYDNDTLCAYICVYCNYVQFSEENVVQHIEKNHSGRKLFARQYNRITLLDLNNAASSARIVATVAHTPHLPNNDSSMYIKSPCMPDSCILCAERTKYFASHYIRYHPEQENYVSRISPTMLREMIAAEQNPTENDDARVACAFCEESAARGKSAWIQHILSHTGEMLFRCRECNHEDTRKRCDCKKPDYKILQRFEFDREGVLPGYVCKLCNYVQLKEQHVEEHLKRSHMIDGDDEDMIAANVMRVRLVDIDYGIGPKRMKEIALMTEYDIKPCHVRVSEFSPITKTEEPIYSCEGYVDLDNVEEVIVLSDSEDDDTEQGGQASKNAEIRPAMDANKQNDTDAVNTHKEGPFQNPVDEHENDPFPNPLDELEELIATITEPILSDHNSSTTESAPEISPLRLTQTVSLRRPSVVNIQFGVPDDVPLKPWTNNNTIKLHSLTMHMLSDKCLTSLFKCMWQKCGFSSSDREQTISHFRFHKEREALTCKIEECTPIECPYCSEYFYSGTEIVNHIESTHGRSIFQCQYCFYRSVDAYGMSLHLDKYHPEKNAVVLICGTHKPFLPSQMEDLLKRQREQIHPILCFEGTC